MAISASDQRRSEILDAVVRVIIDVGFTDMTVADVARAAGVSNALVHYHFTSKAELIEAALQAASLDDRNFREAIATGPGSATARLTGILCDSLPSDGADGSWLLWVETWGETRRNPGIRTVMAELDAHEVGTIVQLIADGEADGEFECADPHAAATSLTALRDGLAIDRTLFHETIPAEQIRSQLRRSLQHHLGLTTDGFRALLTPPTA